MYVESKIYNKLVKITKNTQTHTYREQTSGYQWGEGRREGQDKGRGLRGTNYNMRYKISYKDILYNMGI